MTTSCLTEIPVDDHCDGSGFYEGSGCAGCPECKVCECPTCENDRALDDDADAYFDRYTD